MNHRSWIAVVLSLALMLADGGSPAKARSTPEQKCSSAKIKLAEKKVACLLALRSKGALTGTPPTDAEINACGAKLTAAYGKLDSKGGCATVGDAGQVENKVDAFVDDLATELTPASCPSGCQAQGQMCTANAQCCGQSCDLSIDTCNCAPSGGCCGPGPGGCCGGHTCVGGRCQCFSNGTFCSTNTDCCSGNCNIPSGECQ
jgi:hypothetical protein